MSDQPNGHSTRCRVWMDQVDEAYAPPEEHVLGVEVIGDVLSLEIASYTETDQSSCYERVAEVVVDLHTFLKAIIASTDKDTLVWAVQTPPDLQRAIIEWLRAQGEPK